MSQFYKLESYDERSFCYAYKDTSVRGIQSAVCHSCGSFRWNRQRLYTLVPNVDTWDGSDLCRVSDIPGYIICTKRFVKAVTDTGLTGFCFKAL